MLGQSSLGRTGHLVLFSSLRNLRADPHPEPRACFANAELFTCIIRFHLVNDAHTEAQPTGLLAVVRARRPYCCHQPSGEGAKANPIRADLDNIPRASVAPSPARTLLSPLSQNPRGGNQVHAHVSPSPPCVLRCGPPVPLPEGRFFMGEIACHQGSGGFALAVFPLIPYRYQMLE